MLAKLLDLALKNELTNVVYVAAFIIRVRSLLSVDTLTFPTRIKVK